MTHEEFKKLRMLQNDIRSQSSYASHYPSKRSAKGKAKGYNVQMKRSRIHYQVGLEVIFNTPGWTKRARMY